VLVVVGDDRDRAGMVDDLARHLGPVGAAVAADLDVDAVSLVGDPAVEQFHPGRLAPMPPIAAGPHDWLVGSLAGYSTLAAINANGGTKWLLETAPEVTPEGSHSAASWSSSGSS
jgi:hypothetical protein